MNLSEMDELPEEIQETLDQMRKDPNYGVRWGRLKRKTERPADWPQPVDEAELETPDSDEESLPNRHWLLITGIGIVAIGLILRWWLKRR